MIVALIIVAVVGLLLMAAYIDMKDRQMTEDYFKRLEREEEANKRPLPKVEKGSKWDLSIEEMNR